MSASKEAKIGMSIKVKPTNKELIEQIASEKGVSMSEYVDSLIEKDLQNDAILTGIEALMARVNQVSVQTGNTIDISSDLLSIMRDMNGQLVSIKHDTFVTHAMAKANYLMLCEAVGREPDESIFNISKD